MFKCITFLKCNYVSFRYLSTISQRKKICIVGSGPASFYTAQHLLKNKNIEIDIYEKLPVPFGLIRYGVAPDHPQIKAVITAFSKIAMHERCNFYGNVNVGEDIKVSELQNAYHGIVLAYGAQNSKKIGIPGEDSKNVLSARDFVSWYNGHPKFVNLQFDLDTEVAVVIGQGNVAIDVSRILIQDIDALKKTDIAEHALETLKKSKVKKVIVVGRRGPLQASFTTSEIREMTKMSKFNCIVHPEEFVGIPEILPCDKKSLANPAHWRHHVSLNPAQVDSTTINPTITLERRRARLMDLLLTSAYEKPEKVHEKSWELRFFRKPKTILSDNQGRVEKIVFNINKLKELNISKAAEFITTDEEEVINCGLVLTSVGYQSSPIDLSIPFDENKHIIPNKNGKVLNEKGMYCSGWIQSGPQGVINITMHSSFTTADKILDDIDNGNLERNLSMERSDLLELLKKRGVKFVTFEDWLKIDKVELERGKVKEKPREKICSMEEMLNIADVA